MTTILFCWKETKALFKSPLRNKGRRGVLCSTLWRENEGKKKEFLRARV